jgi:apolipoprotein D and lipocalin family protein
MRFDLRLLPLFSSLIAPLLAAGALAQTAVPVPALDLKMLTGSWYEVARLPDKPQKNCTGAPILLIALGDKLNQLQFVDSCSSKSGYTDAHDYNSTLADLKKKGPKVVDGKLKIGSFWPFTSKLWVLSLDDTSAIVGSPNHKKLWILSRSTSMDQGQLSNLEAKAASEGYATSKLIVAK